MRQFELKRTLFGADITAQITVFDEGVQVLIFGGTRPHIGAVSVIDPAGVYSTTQFPGHKDGIVSEQWTKALSAAEYRPAVIIAGIHYDDLSRGQITEVVEMTDDMLDELLCVLSKTDSETSACG